MSVPLATSVIDLAALDEQDQPILIAQVQTRPVEEDDLAYLSSSLSMLAHVVPFAMLANQEEIRLYQWDGKELSNPVAVLRTSDALREYEPEFGQIRIFQRYLVTLIELRDLAYHWKSNTPPGSQQLRKAGLLDKLVGGTTRTEVEIIGGHLRSLP
jgi:hypothetical protein